jgi:hypothetical protein
MEIHKSISLNYYGYSSINCTEENNNLQKISYFLNDSYSNPLLISCINSPIYLYGNCGENIKSKPPLVTNNYLFGEINENGDKNNLPNLDKIGSQIKVLPNPVKDKLIIINSGKTTELSIRMFDINGRQLLTFSSNLSRTEIDMTKYAKGSYFILIEDLKNKIQGKKIIIKQ